MYCTRPKLYGVSNHTIFGVTGIAVGFDPSKPYIWEKMICFYINEWLYQFDLMISGWFEVWL